MLIQVGHSVEKEKVTVDKILIAKKTVALDLKCPINISQLPELSTTDATCGFLVDTGLVRIALY